MNFEIITCAAILLASVELSVELLVRTNQGPVRSRQMYVGSHAVYAFKNIPYVKQPVGYLRFQLPEESNVWLSEDDLQAETEIRCPQQAYFEDEDGFDSFLGQEDCLYLDVYVRKEHERESESLPVVAYFHGGLFHRGSKEEYGPDFLLRFNDIILVVPNYRLGILGFLSLHDTLLPGNLGLWDQNAALKWVSANIVHFGGDPHRITIAGHEAGAVSVGLHILASPSHDYFQGAISGSGTALSPWLVDTKPSPSKANAVAEHLNCPETSKSDILICLKTAPLRDILKAQGKLKNVHFLPTVDSVAETSFIPYSPKTMYQKGYQKNVKYLIGFTENEGSNDVNREFPNVLKYQHLDKMIRHFLLPYFKDNLKIDTIVKAAKYHYLRGIMIPTFESIEPQIAKMMTDFLYKTPMEETVKLHQQKGGNVFAYIFKENDNVYGLENRRHYGNEYYVFNSSEHEIMMDYVHPDVQRTIETVSKFWGNFIRLGYPDNHKRWEPIHDSNEFRYAEISDIIQPKINYGSDDSEFWITLVSELNSAKNWSEVSSDYLFLPSEYSTIGTWGAASLAILFGVLCVALVGMVIITKRKTLIMSIVPSVASERH